MRPVKAVSLSALLVIVGCASTQMYSYDGFLTVYGGEQTKAELKSIRTECKKIDVLDSNRYDCLRDILPLRLRWDEAFADLTEEWLIASGRVARGYESGDISEDTARETMDSLSEEYKFQNKMLNEEYTKIVSTRNAREQLAARQRQADAFSQIGSDLLKQSSSSKSVTCTETVPGTVSCSDW